MTPLQPTYNLFPELDLYHYDWLKISTLHHLYFEECGNPLGQPVIFLHGGPGSGCNATHRRFFDPAFYRIILLDQRGCGRSRPQGETKENTTDDLVADIEMLRQHLNVDKWLVFGGSWGSTLALVYALSHTSRVQGLILRGIFLSRPTELLWFLGQVQLFHPEAWQKLISYLPADEQCNPIIAFEKRVFSKNVKISIPAATHWNAFEGSMMTLLPKAFDEQASKAQVTNGEIELARARIQIHYIQQHCFVTERDLLNEASQKLSNTPTDIIQGRYDMVCPPLTAWQLAQAMPHATYTVIENAGHSGMEIGITSALVAATEKFKQML